MSKLPSKLTRVQARRKQQCKHCKKHYQWLVFPGKCNKCFVVWYNKNIECYKRIIGEKEND